MIGYFIDGRNLTRSQRLDIDAQLLKHNYVYNSVEPLHEFKFYDEKGDFPVESLALPPGIKVELLRPQ